jgi:sn-glycerol 3-phosphate transport system substrate-binding protein
VAKNAKFAYALSPCPTTPTCRGAAEHVIGGASLWVMSGKKPEVLQGRRVVLHYLSSPEVQSASHKRTGYLPITTAAYQLTEKSGFLQEKPGTTSR